LGRSPVTKDGSGFAFVEAFSKWGGDYNLARMVADFHTLTFIGSVSQNVDIYISWTFEGRGEMTMSMPKPRMMSAARAARDEIKALMETFQRVANAEMKDPPRSSATCRRTS
jgi:hypothetical protein